VTVEGTAVESRRTWRRLRDRASGWRRESFGPASEKPFRRRSVDGIRLVIATLALVVLSLRANNVPRGEQGLFTYFNSLPSGLSPLFRGLYAAGTLWTGGLVIVAALVGRRFRLSLAMLLTGAGAWFAARVTGQIVVQDLSFRRSLHVITRLHGTTPHFPLVRLAIVVAIVTAAAPYVGRPSRRIGALLVLGVAIAAMYLGNAYPRDVLGGAFLGWGVASVVALLFGSPGGRPTARQVAASLRQLGVEASDVHLAAHQPTGSTLMVARDQDGPLRVSVLGRDETDSQFLAKLARSIVYRDSGPPLTATRVHQLQLEALAMSLAGNNHARVPTVLVVGKAGPGAALLVEREFGGARLDTLDADVVTDTVLDALWQQVASIHGARVVHRHLDARHVLLTSDGPAVVGFERAALSASPEQRARDVAQLLASTTAIVGDERAVGACVRVIGPSALAAALPLLQPAALDRNTRNAFHGGRRELSHRITGLRERAARTAEVEPPALQQLRRISGANLALAIGTLVAVGALLVQVGNPDQLWDAMLRAAWGWVIVSLVLSMATNIGYAVALMGSVPDRLPLWPATECQIAMSFSNLAIPAVGGYAIQVRFLQKQGIDLASAVAAGGILNTAANTGVQLALFGIAVSLTPDSLDLQLSNIQTATLLKYSLVGALLLAAGSGIVLGLRQLRQRVMPPVARAAGTLWAVLRSPQRLAQLVGGNIATTVLYTLVLEADLIAFGSHVSFWTLLALNVGIGTIASLVPIAGGTTAVSAVGMTGALAALGVSQSAAVAAVLVNQLVVWYIPALPGWLATRDMLKRDEL
jgi:uncharacterized membrane protein YbhN (UPF0104 family)/membrane-associated phospholipid phosphatase/tRNA A-37 threonylcarbamoyl transferase component Bud32